MFVNALEGTLVLRKALDYETLSNFTVNIRAQVTQTEPGSRFFFPISSVRLPLHTCCLSRTRGRRRSSRTRRCTSRWSTPTTRTPGSTTTATRPSCRTAPPIATPSSSWQVQAAASSSPPSSCSNAKTKLLQYANQTSSRPKRSEVERALYLLLFEQINKAHPSPAPPSSPACTTRTPRRISHSSPPVPASKPPPPHSTHHRPSESAG